jgi:G3E family GTPase
MVTVVDAANLVNDYASSDFQKDRGESLGDADNRTLVDLLVDQIEFANVIILNKISAASLYDRDLTRKILRTLNPDAKVIETDFAKVALDEVLNTGLFDFDKAQEHPLWYKELNGFADHVPETEEYGVRSFVYRERRPFDPQKFQDFIQRNWTGVIRAKGFFWLATRPDHVGELGQAGALVRTEKHGLWWASISRNRWPHHPEWHLDPVWGDRRQELVFIGVDAMNEADLRAQLDACLVNATEFTPHKWEDLFDPFPSWAPQAA